VAPEVGYPKSARALKPGGALAVFRTHAPTPLSGFAVAVQEVYRREAPQIGRAPEISEPLEERIARETQRMEQSGLFASVTVRQYPWAREYNREEYLRLVNTYSDHRTLEPGRRAALLAGIGEMIDRDFGGKVERPYVSVLYLGKKLSMDSAEDAEDLVAFEERAREPLLSSEQLRKELKRHGKI
jgi:hypothetical protein